MKVAIKVPIADVLTTWIMLENRRFKVLAIGAICSGMPQFATDGTSAIITLNINKTVQDAGYATSTAATSFQIIDNAKIEAFQNIVDVSIAKFIRGVSYLIPAGTYNPLPMVPNIWSSNVGGATSATGYGGVMVATHYLYNCDETADILNTTSISGAIQLEMIGAVIEAASENKAQQKAAENINFASAIGMPSAVRAATDIRMAERMPY